jgi:hypothetical protein
MQRSALFEFERAVCEFAKWRAVPEADRSPAPGWWWGPAMAVFKEPETMPTEWCTRLELAPSCTYAAGAAVLMNTLSSQTSLSWPDEFPGKRHRNDDTTQKPLAP